MEYKEIQEYIDKQGININKMCKMAGINPSSVRNYASGRQGLSDKTEAKLIALIRGGEESKNGNAKEKAPTPCYDCFAYYEYGSNKHRCLALRVKYCQGKDCSTYKTQEQVEANQKKATERLRSLPYWKQRKIKEKYGIAF